MKVTMHKIVLSFCFSLLMVIAIFAQEDAQNAQKLAEKALQASKNLTYEANETLVQNDFINAEGNYRKAISKSQENAVAPYNLGRAYYNRESYTEAFGRFKQAGEKAAEKPVKHKAYHNMGNVFMKNKEYEKAVEAYKQSLRNNPNDDETRYNLALAKEMLKKQQDEQKNDQNKDDEQKNDEQKDDKNKNQDQNQDGENEKDKEGDQEDDQNKDEGDDGDKGEQKPEDNKEGEGDEKKEQKQQPKDGDKQKEQKKPRPNQLSKQQIQNLLEAMQNEEKKVQEKMEAKKVKGAKIKNEKDW